GVVCQGGYGRMGGCPEGSTCKEDLSAPLGITCECDDASDGICPDPACVDDADCQGCTPHCQGRFCGDNGCGGSCGMCSPVGETCNAGQCVCLPNCSGKFCGDDGCGSQCGSCPADSSCDDGVCKANESSTSCLGDSCQGSWGNGGCCEEARYCVFGNCTPTCGETNAGCSFNEDCCKGWSCIDGACAPINCPTCKPDDLDLSISLIYAGVKWGYTESGSKTYRFEFEYAIKNESAKSVELCYPLRLYFDEPSAPSMVDPPTYLSGATGVAAAPCRVLQAGETFRRWITSFAYDVGGDLTTTGKAWATLDVKDHVGANNVATYDWKVLGPYF
ncbi:MAG: hypothetical protein JRH20_30180, partial [Deltaproteobacteria bacterium]|nr:hypothetical protein [Deltaproteobacteria bacterium]